MDKGRLEAFSDGVIAVAITIMVLQIEPPHGTDLASLQPLLPAFLNYVLSFVYVGIYWSNHHHLLHAADHVSGAVLWANLHLLFWLTLIPFATAWMGAHDTEALPAAVYGVVLLMAAVAYFILARTLVRLHGTSSRIGRAIGRDWKTRLSAVAYIVAIVLAFIVSARVADALYLLVALVWLVPDRRIERRAVS
ncbi:MAG TPA: TMEM175 family protein [Nevskiaceae bacterium]|nr:TMEM175 family protein [Nevskiaceae bacterium]